MIASVTALRDAERVRRGHQLMKERGIVIRPKPAFGHGIAYALPNGQTLIGCYRARAGRKRTPAR